MKNNQSIPYIGKRILLLSICLIFSLTFQLSSPIQTKVFGQNSKDSKKMSVDDVITKQAEKTFEKGRALLVERGVPFEPNDLLDRKNYKEIISKLSNVPDFYNIEITENRIKGVKIADTIYLPEKVELKGDTVIVARSIIFEGQDVLIKGSHDLHVFPLERVGLLGTTLSKALRNQKSQFIKTRATNNSSMNYSSLRLPLIRGGNIKIDLHGFGREDWLKQKNEKSLYKFTSLPADFNSKLFKKVNYRGVNFIDDTGSYGGDGPTGGMGGTGTTGNTGIGGTNGSCTGSINGTAGTAGTAGGIGGTGSKGGNGGTGGNGNAVSFTIPDGSTQNYTFDTSGGGGGNGGTGGTGGFGGTGGDGGDGGNGAGCACTVGQGNGGNGGNGGNAGSGGTGGVGGNGGNGGNAGNIFISKPFGFSGNINTTADGGSVGLGGLAGGGGVGGSFGDGGDGGTEGTNPGCSPSGGSSGNDGSDGNAGGNGGGGNAGNGGTTPGTAGTVNIVERPDEICEEEEQLCELLGGTWKGCVLGCFSPIVIDIDGNGYNLTNGQNGVDFDLTGQGTTDRTSWTRRNSDDAWLVLDRNGNGTIDNGLELFGNFTPQPVSIPRAERNGFYALAEYDKPENGGNNDGKINRLDSIFRSLRLWQDKNHNGISEQSELFRLRQLDVRAIDLDFRTSRKTDRHGNRFLYRSKVRDKRGASVGRWAWDVFLVRPR